MDTKITNELRQILDLEQSESKQAKEPKDHSTPNEIKHRQRRKKIQKLATESKRRNRR